MHEKKKIVAIIATMMCFCMLFSAAAETDQMSMNMLRGLTAYSNHQYWEAMNCFLFELEEKENADAMLYVSKMLAAGQGFDEKQEDSAEPLTDLAAVWAAKAALCGNAEAAQTTVSDEAKMQAESFTLLLMCAQLRYQMKLYEMAYGLFYGCAAEYDPVAMYWLGYMMENGEGVQQNAALAKAWYQKAVELGNADAAKALADRDDADMDTLYQLAVPLYKAEMYDAAYPLFEKAGQLGESRGLYYVGLMRQKGLGTAQDYDGAFAAYQQSADAGYDGALTALGTMYLNGMGRERDVEKAEELYTLSAEKGSRVAMYNPGILYKRGDLGQADAVKAAEWFQKALDAGYEQAQEKLDELQPALDELNAKKGDTEAAQRVAQQLAEEPDKLYTVAYDAYCAGYEEAAAVMMTVSADHGNALAQFYSGYMLINGLGVEQDVTQALQYYEASAGQHVAAAMQNLGVYYYGQKDLENCLIWFQRGAELGDAGNMKNLGIVYANGELMEPDLEKAREWYQKAADLGNEEAAALLEQLDDARQTEDKQNASDFNLSINDLQQLQNMNQNK